MRRVLSVWLPLLPTERLSPPSPSAAAPQDRPLATATSGATRRLVALNRAARAAGLRSGSTVADALAVAPALVLAPAEPEADRALLERLADWCGRYTPFAAADAWAQGPDCHGLWLDIAGCDHLFGGEAAMLAHLTERLGKLGFTVRAAIADTPGAAWAWARFGSRTAPILAPGRPREELAPLPVAALRLSPAAATGLAGLGLTTIGALYATPRASLAARFGREVCHRLDQALGDEAEPISPRQPPAPHRVHATFAEPIARTDDVVEATRRLLDRLCEQLGRENLGLNRLEVTLFRVDSSSRSLAVGTGRPSRDARHLMRLLTEKLSAMDAGFGIEMIRVSATEIAPLDPQQTGLAATVAPDALGRLVDGLANRLGRDRVVRFAPRHSHLPERAVQVVPLGAPMPNTGAWAAGRRPLRLFDRPEPVEAMAPVPDSPPVLFRWRNRAHRIVRADGPERIAAEWWRKDAPERDYYCVEDEAGRRFWLFREGLYGAEPAPKWFVHGVFG